MPRPANVSPILLLSFLLVVSLSCVLPPLQALAGSVPSPGEQEYGLPIGLTEEEKSRLHEIGSYTEATDPPAAPVRQCAQWEPVTGVVIRYNYGFGIPYDLIQEYAEDLLVHVLCRSNQQQGAYDNLANHGVNMDNVTFINCRTNSIWTRDYGPQSIFSNGLFGFVDHVYNRPRPYDDVVSFTLGTEWGIPVYGTDLIHSGGNFMSDGHGIGFSTDMVWDENPGLTHEQIDQLMEDYLGVTNYVIVPDIDPSGIHHIDCWAKLLDEETILVKEVPSDHPHYAQLEANVAYLETLTNCYGRPYKIVRVHCGSLGGTDVAAYTNSLILNNKVFVPIYGISSDSTALATYQDAMPGYEVFGFDDGWLSDDAIHCRGLGIHDQYMLVVDTNPLQDQEYNTGDYYVAAFIDDRSEAGLVTDSLLVYWRVEGSPEFTPMVMDAAAHPDSYYVYIPQQADSVNIEYYVFAEDNSGRQATRPMVAPGAWYTFNTGAEITVATLLQAYSADVDPSGITVRWAISEWTPDMQFFVLRTEGNEGIYKELPAPKIQRQGLSFVFTDEGNKPGTSYRYRVDIMDGGARRILFDTDPISTPATVLAHFQNHPNPFNPSTTIEYLLPDASPVTLEIFDIRGRQVVCLVDEKQSKGRHFATWDGRDAGGNSVSSGTYFCRLRVGEEIVSHKMTLLR